MLPEILEAPVLWKHLSAPLARCDSHWQLNWTVFESPILPVIVRALPCKVSMNIQHESFSVVRGCLTRMRCFEREPMQNYPSPMKFAGSKYTKHLQKAGSLLKMPGMHLEIHGGFPYLKPRNAKCIGVKERPSWHSCDAEVAY